MKVWIAIVLVVVVAMIVAWAACIKNCRYLLNTQKDLYAPLAIADAKAHGKGYEMTARFENRYLGTHMIALVVENHLPIGEDYEIEQLGASLVVARNGSVVLEKTIDKPVYPFWGHLGDYSGFALLNYEVPQDLPRGGELNCWVRLSDDGVGLMEKYGSVRLLIAKVSDK